LKDFWGNGLAVAKHKSTFCWGGKKKNGGEVRNENEKERKGERDKS